jgi:hypothetical protein
VSLQVTNFLITDDFSLQCKKLHEHFLKIKQGVYVGASGWTYTGEGGFNVTDDTRDAWHNFVKAHPHFKNFATRGWAHFQVVNEIVLENNTNSKYREYSRVYIRE